jgi:putative transposase
VFYQAGGWSCRDGSSAENSRSKRQACQGARGVGGASRTANLLDRQFAAERPNQKWIADFTYFWTAEGWLYVAAVIDLFSRRVVG